MTSLSFLGSSSAIEALSTGFFYDMDSLYNSRVDVYVYDHPVVIGARVSSFTVTSWILAEAGYTGPTEEQVYILKEAGLYNIDDVANYAKNAGLLDLLTAMRELGMPIHEMGEYLNIGYQSELANFVHENWDLFESNILDLILNKIG